MEAVILDVGGVLLVPHFEVVNAALEPFGVVLDAETAERAHYYGVAALDAADEDGRAERDAYLRAYAAAAGVPNAVREQAVARMSDVWRGPTIDLWRQPVSGSADGLRALHASGRKLGIVSNSDGTVEEQLRVHEICQVGEGVGVPVLAIVDSRVVGVSKPAAEIFRHALEPLGVDPERVAYVGDTVRYDVRGARAAGLVPIHCDPYALCRERGNHAHVARLADIEPLLGP